MPRGGVAAPSQRVFVLLALALLAAPSLLADEAGETGSRFDKKVERLVAMPTPIGPLLVLGDAAVWRVDIPASAVVLVEAWSEETSPFYYRYERMGSAPSTFFVPSTHAGSILPPGAWRVTIDPAGGVAVDINVRFLGQTGGVGGGPNEFTLTTIANDNPCLLATVCLP